MKLKCCAEQCEMALTHTHTHIHVSIHMYVSCNVVFFFAIDFYRNFVSFMSICCRANKLSENSIKSRTSRVGRCWSHSASSFPFLIQFLLSVLLQRSPKTFRATHATQKFSIAITTISNNNNKMEHWHFPLFPSWFDAMFARSKNSLHFDKLTFLVVSF